MRQLLQLRDSSDDLVDGLLERHPALIDRDRVLVEPFAGTRQFCLLAFIEAGRRVRARVERPPELGSDLLAGGLVAVQLQHELIELGLGESLVNDIEGSRLLRNEEHSASGSDQFGDDVRDRLALARARRTVHHEAVAVPCRQNANPLRGVGVPDAHQVLRRGDGIEILVRRWPVLALRIPDLGA